MLFRDSIDLINISNSLDDVGDPVETKTYSAVYADKRSIRQSEFYQAIANGLRPEMMFIVRSIDYGEQKKIRYNNKEYTIIRTYDKDNEFIELICSSY